MAKRRILRDWVTQKEGRLRVLAPIPSQSLIFRESGYFDLEKEEEVIALALNLELAEWLPQAIHKLQTNPRSTHVDVFSDALTNPGLENEPLALRMGRWINIMDLVDATLDRYESTTPEQWVGIFMEALIRAFRDHHIGVIDVEYVDPRIRELNNKGKKDNVVD